MEWASLVRFTVALVLLVSVVAKLPRPGAFIQAVRSYEIIPNQLTAPVAVVVVAGETFASAALLVGFAIPKTLIVAACLFGAFSGTVAVALRRKRSVACGCLANVVSLELGWTTAVLNASIAIACTAAAFAPVAAGVIGVNAGVLRSAVLFSTATLVAAAYWLAAYAESVMKRIEASAQGPRVV